MNLRKPTLWVAFGLGVLTGPALAAAVTCTVSPTHSVIVEGESMTLEAVCNGALSSIDWRMDGVSVSGTIPLPGHVAGEPVYLTTPVGAGGANSFGFTVSAVPASTADTFGGSSTARVVVKPSSAVVAKAAGLAAPMTPVAATCGSANGLAVTAMPAGAAACGYGKPVLQITGPSNFSWTCESLTGGADANCYATRGATTTTSPTTTTNVDGTCGPAANVATSVPPPAGRCAAGSTAGPIITTSMQYSWSCSGTGLGATASCSAPRGYAVTATAGTGGTITPASRTVTAYGTTTFTVTPNAGYAATVTGCGGTLSGNIYTTGQVYSNCSVAASFAQAALAPSASGCTIPAGTTVYTTASPEPYVAALDTLFDLATSASTLDSTIAAFKTKAYEFSNDKAFKNGSIYNFYSTGQKDMSISACPGDFNVPAECKALAQMSPRIYWSRDGVAYVHPTYSYLTYPTCNIGTSGTVYLNIRNTGTTSVSYQIRSEVLNK